MKLLIAYDGSRCSEAALDDLVRAGIPDAAECRVISVAEVWLPPNGHRKTENTEKITGIHLGAHYEKVIRERYAQDEMVIAEALAFAHHAENRLEKMFPTWKIEAEATYGSPAWAILETAEEYSPDLIVVGLQGRTALGRFVLGSISQKVLTEATCSVRVARGRIEVDPVPSRIVIGFDGSSGAEAAVAAVAARNWREFSEVRLVSVVDDGMPAAIGRFTDPEVLHLKEYSSVQHKWMEQLADAVLAKLEAHGIPTTLCVCSGNAKEVIVRESERWNADCIFIGANSTGSKLSRFLLGSTASAIAARAHCSVEVVRA
jgi:nucleotide-binding universal stress UspA family protein